MELRNKDQIKSSKTLTPDLYCVQGKPKWGEGARLMREFNSHPLASMGASIPIAIHSEEAHGIYLHLFFSGNPVAQTDAIPRIFLKG